MSDGNERPAPPTDGLAGEYYDWHARGELRLQRCGGCRRWNHPPVETCPACGSGDLRWEPVSGHGEVFTWTVTHHPFDPAFMTDGPYVCAVVRTAEGPRLLSALPGVAPDDVSAGMPVTVAFEDRGAGRKIAVFQPRSTA